MVGWDQLRGVLAFLFADLIVLPIIAIYSKYYGTPFALRITALMFVTMAIAALIVDRPVQPAGGDPERPAPDTRRHLRLDPRSTTSCS